MPHQSNQSKFLLSIIGSAMSLAIAASAQAQQHPEKPTYKYEKCYGVAKSGKNDCFTASHSCAGTSKVDGQRDAWVYLPKGTCEKIVGGSLDPHGE